jgi:carbonic anhydrase/acetyltransferase-like protein (isoleucine patch superfamily)
VTYTEEFFMGIYKLDGVVDPQIDPSAWVADSAQVIGQVELHKDSSVWFGTVIRGDNDLMQIGEGSNIQENCVLHTDPGMPLVVGKHVTVGHQVTLHGCHIGDGSLIGIGAVVLNGAKIGKHCLVGAGSLVTEGKEFPDGSMILGSPAKVVKPLSPEQINGLLNSAKKYVENAKRFKKGLTQIG